MSYLFIDHCCIKYGNVSLTLKNGCPVSPNMANDELDSWVHSKFNFISCQVVGLLAKLEHPISSLLLEIFTLTLQINEALLSMANEKIFKKIHELENLPCLCLCHSSLRCA